MYRVWIYGIRKIEDQEIENVYHRVVKANSKEEVEKQIREDKAYIKIDRIIIEEIL